MAVHAASGESRPVTITEGTVRWSAPAQEGWELWLARHGVSGAGPAVKHRDFAEQVSRTLEVQGQPAAVGIAGLDADLVVLNGDPASDVKHFSAVKCTTWSWYQAVAA